MSEQYVESDTSDQPVRIRVNPLFQILAIFVSLVTTLFAFNYRLSRPRFHDIAPTLFTITPDTIREWQSDSSIIRTGLYIDQFETFNVIQNHFIFNGTVWFRLNQNSIDLETLGKFSFSRGQLLYRSEPEVHIVNNMLFVRYNVRVECTSPLEYKDFPLDSHHIYIILENQSLSPEQASFSTTERDTISNADIISSGWQQIDKGTKTGYRETTLDTYGKEKRFRFPIALFIFDYTRHGIRHLTSIFLPLILIFYVALFCFSIRAFSSIPLTTVGITTIAGYRFVIGTLSPSTGYLTLADYIFFLYLFATMLTFILNLIDLSAIEIPLKIKRFIVASLHIITSCVNVYFLLW